MPGLITPKQSLWREAFRLFNQYMDDWLKPAGCFFVVGSAIGIINQGLRPNVATDNPALATLTGLANIAVALASVFFYFFLIYYFWVFYLKREPITRAPVLNQKGFWYMIGQIWLTWLATIGVALLGGVVASAGYGVLLLMKLQSDVALPIMAGLCVLLLLYYMNIKYALVGPLAASRVQKTLKNSWQLTERNWWRIFWNSVAIGFLLMLPFVVIMFVLVLLIHELTHASIKEIYAGFSFTVIYAAIQVIFAGVTAAYGCASARILYQEKQQSDPSFVLTTNT